MVLSVALSLAIGGGAWAKSQDSGYDKDSGSYSSGQGTGSGSQSGKKQTPPAGCQADGPLGVCAPPAAPKKSKPSTSRPSEPGASK